MCNKAVVPPCAGRKRHARPKTAGAHFYKHSAVREALVRKIRLIDALPEGRYWQSLHQQARVAAGVGWIQNGTAPQKHRPAKRLTIRVLSQLLFKPKQSL